MRNDTNSSNKQQFDGKGCSDNNAEGTVLCTGVVTPVEEDKVKAEYPLPLDMLFSTSLRSRAAYSASIPSASGAIEKTICDSRHKANSLWCCFSAQSHGVSRFSFSTNKSEFLCTSNCKKVT